MKKFVIFGTLTTIVVLLLLAYFSPYLDSSFADDDVRIEVGYKSLNLPESFVQVSKTNLETKGDIITSALSAETRVYKVPMNMLDTRDFLSQVLQEEEEVRIYQKDRDVRLSMHDGFLGLNGFLDTCSPAQIPIKGGKTFLTVILSNNLEESKVELDGDGQVYRLKDEYIPVKDDVIIEPKKYDREYCNVELKETYVTFVVWVM